MDSYTITSGLDSFVLIDFISEINSKSIKGLKIFIQNESWLGVEAMAQCAAMFVRKQVDFKKHTFLMKTKNVIINSDAVLDGKYDIECMLKGASDEAYLFDCSFSKNNKKIISGTVLIGTMEYDDNFKQPVLEKYYRELYQCLIKE